MKTLGVPLASLIIALSLPSCTDSAASDAAVDAVQTPDALDAGSASDADGAEVEASPVEESCLIDFPCAPNETMRCIDDGHFVALVSHPCSFRCGTLNCSGGSCDPEGEPQPCPSGTTCVNSGSSGRCVGAADDATSDGLDATGSDVGVE